MTKLEMVNEMLNPQTEPQKRYAERWAKSDTKKSIETTYWHWKNGTYKKMRNNAYYYSSFANK